MSRGGSRQGAQGASYGLRTDLNQNRAPVSLPTPVAPTPQAAGPVQSAQPTAIGAPPGPAIPSPGSLNTFGVTGRPNEPLTHGLATGPGGGPEVLQQPFTPDPMAQAAAVFAGVPAAHVTPQMRALIAATNASAANASQPGVAQGGAA